MPSKTKQKKVHTSGTDTSQLYYTDLSSDKVLYAALIRSPISKGTIRSISCPNLPPDCRLITARDIPGKNNIQILSDSLPVFAFENVSYQGEPIGLITSPDYETALYFAKNSDIRFTRSFEKEKDEAITEDRILARRVVKYGDSDTVFEETDIKTEQTVVSKLRTSRIFNELDGAFVVPIKDTLEVYCPTNWMINVNKVVATATAFSESNVIIKRTMTNDCGTNRIWLTSVLAAQTAVASVVTKRPVKLVLTRDEQQKFIDNPQETKIRYRSAVAKDGTITAMDVSISLDGGAFDPFISEMVDRLVIASLGIYMPKNFTIEATALRTPTPPRNTDFRRIDIHAFAALESHLHTLADLAGLTPIELRKHNINPKSIDRPFLIPVDKALEVLDASVKTSDFNRKYAAYSIRSREPLPWRSYEQINEPIRGIGLACAFNGNCYFGTSLDSSKQILEVVMDIDGSLTIYTEQLSLSIKKIWARIASKILDISEDLIHFSRPENLQDQAEVSNVLFGNVGVMTQLLRKSCMAIQKQRFRLPLPIRIKRTATLSKRSGWNQTEFKGTPFHDASFGAAVIELELDKYTYKEQIRGIWITLDAGEILDVNRAEQTVRSSVERVLSSLTDSQLSTPNINVYFAESTSTPKQIHDLADNIIPGAYKAALSQAIRNQIQVLPSSSNIVYKAGMNQIAILGGQS